MKVIPDSRRMQMSKDSRVNIARKVLQDGKLPVDEGNREIFPRCNVASATALKIDSDSVLSAFGVVYCYA